jgi:outer membrane biosynthesis protein TonB
MKAPKKRNSSRVNFIISILFHTALVAGVLYLAARQGILGKKLKEITVTMVPKEKKPELPKEKPPPPKIEPPKPAEPPKTAATAPPPKAEPAAPPPSDTPPAAAPPPVELPSFGFSDGAHAVQSVSDPDVIYKGLIERALRSHWNKPEDIADDNFVAEVELSIDPDGNITASRWINGSGNARWDSTVKTALAATKTIGRPPPKGFPNKFITRFDVESQRTEDAIHLSSQ